MPRAALKFLSVNLVTRRLFDWQGLATVGSTLVFVAIVVLYNMRDRPLG